MRGRKRRIEINPVAEFERGSVETNDGDFFRLYIRAMTEDYDYNNWSRKEIEELRDALTWILENYQ